MLTPRAGRIYAGLSRKALSCLFANLTRYGTGPTASTRQPLTNAGTQVEGGFGLLHAPLETVLK